MKPNSPPIPVLYVGPLNADAPLLDRVKRECGGEGGGFNVTSVAAGDSIHEPSGAEAEFVVLHESAWSEEAMRAARRCRAIIQFGAEAHCDLELARELGIFVSDVSGSATEGLEAFATAKMKAFLEVWESRDRKSPPSAPRRPRAGLLGLGRLGERLASGAGKTGFDVLAHDPFALDEAFMRSGARQVPMLEDLMGMSDLLMMQVPGCDANRHLVSSRELEIMRPGSWLINLGWPDSLDASAAGAALTEGRLGRLMLTRAGVATSGGPTGEGSAGSRGPETVILPAETAELDMERGLLAAFTMIRDIAKGEEPPSLLIDPPCPRLAGVPS